MKVKSSIFGDISIDDNRIIHFVNGLIGFPDLKDFALLTDDKEVRWLQSMQKGDFVFPVADPLAFVEDYDPMVEEELLTVLGDLSENNLLVLVIMTAPQDETKISLNLKAPLVVNAENLLACQVLAEGEESLLKFPIYDILQA